MYIPDWIGAMAIHVLRMTGRFTQSKKANLLNDPVILFGIRIISKCYLLSYGALSLFACFLKGFSPPSILFYSLSVNQLLRLLPSIHSFPLLGYCFPLGSINGPYCSIVSKTLKTIVLKVGYCELLSVSALLF